MSEKSGLEMISELVREIKIMNQKLNILDSNIKRLMNSAKISEIATKALGTPLRDWAVPVKSNRVEAVEPPKHMIKKDNMRFGFESVDASKTLQESPNRSTRADKPTLCMCKGKMVASNSKKTVPLPGLSVKIFNDKDKLIKETKTNRAGEWMSQLSPGNYIANIEGTLKGQQLYPINLNFQVLPGMHALEVK